MGTIPKVPVTKKGISYEVPFYFYNALKISSIREKSTFEGVVKCKVNTDIYQFCGMKKLICISEFENNLIHHLPNIYINGERGRGKLGSFEDKMKNTINQML